MRKVLCGSVVCGAITLTAACLSIGGCGPAPFEATFETGGQADVFGTLIDDRGTFEFLRNPDTGNLQRVEADDGTITLPTDGQSFALARPDGSSLTLGPQGAENALIAVRNDPSIGSADLVVDREALGPLAAVVPANARIVAQLASCEENQAFVDSACAVVNEVEIQALADSILEDLETSGDVALLNAVITGVLERYLEIVIDCCLAWDEFRDGGGEACD